MGYSIKVTNKAAREAVKRGVAEVTTVPGGVRTVYDDDGNYAGEERDPDRRVLSFKGEKLSMSDWGHPEWGFWSHCSYGGSLGHELSSMLGRLGVDYRREE